MSKMRLSTYKGQQMPSTAYLLKSLRTFHPGRSPLIALADSIGSTLRCLERVAENSSGEYPSQQLLWDVYENALQTLSGFRQRENINLPPAPATPANAPPTVLLATIHDWLIQIDRPAAQATHAEPIDQARAPKALAVGRRQVWDLLRNRVMAAKEISVKVYGNPLKEDAIRKRIAAIRQAGWRIEWMPGLGYYRADAPPPDFTGPERESC